MVPPDQEDDWFRYNQSLAIKYITYTYVHIYIWPPSKPRRSRAWSLDALKNGKPCSIPSAETMVGHRLPVMWHQHPYFAAQATQISERTNTFSRQHEDWLHERNNASALRTSAEYCFLLWCRTNTLPTGLASLARRAFHFIINIMFTQKNHDHAHTNLRTSITSTQSVNYNAELFIRCVPPGLFQV